MMGFVCVWGGGGGGTQRRGLREGKKDNATQQTVAPHFFHFFSSDEFRLEARRTPFASSRSEALKPRSLRSRDSTSPLDIAHELGSIGKSELACRNPNLPVRRRVFFFRLAVVVVAPEAIEIFVNHQFGSPPDHSPCRLSARCLRRACLGCTYLFTAGNERGNA